MRGIPPTPLAALPDDVLVLILARLPWRDIARVTGWVSRSWRIAAGREEVWLRVADAHGVRMPASRGRSLRSEADLRRAFFMAARRREEVQIAETESALTGLLQKLKRGEVATTTLAKFFPGNDLARPGEVGHQRQAVGARGRLDVNHRLLLHSGRTVAFVAGM